MRRCGPGWMLFLSACIVETSITDPEPSDAPPAAPAVRVDADGDGYTEAEGDCDDTDPTVGPEVAFVEVCDLVDNDCDGEPDDSGVCIERDRFDQQMNVDVLFVVDTSLGMEPYLGQAGKAATQFVHHLVGNGLDTRIGVLPMAFSPDGSHPGLVRVAGTHTLEGLVHDQDFAARWIQDAIGSLKPTYQPPRARDALLDHLDVVAEWDARSFLRSDVPLVLVFLSREDDASDTPLADFRDELAEIYDVLPTMHSIVRLADGACDGDTVGAYGEDYVALSEMSGGVTVDVCTRSYQTFFFVTGQLAADEGLGRRYYLDKTVNIDLPMVVEVTLPGGFSELLDASDYDVVEGGKVLVLHSPPAAGSELVVDYHRLP